MKIIVSRLEGNHQGAGSGPAEWRRLVYRVDLGDKVFDTYFSGSELTTEPGLEAGLALALLPGMRLNRPIHVQGTVSTTFVRGANDFMTVMARHFPEFTPVEITADAFVTAPASEGHRIASFFSGGVDSFFTLIKGQKEISDVVFIHGFDMSIKALERRALVIRNIAQAAREMGVRLIEVETNLAVIIREFSDWLRHGHGLGMAAVSRVLGRDISEIRIPGSYSIDQQKPWGSWLATDPLFSDERLKVTHDACLATRSDKVRAITLNPFALNYLRVCSEKRAGDVYNCCRCEKCLRTMTSLYAMHALERAASFHLPLDPRSVADVLLPRIGLRIFPNESLALLREFRPQAKELIAALETQRSRPVWWSRMRLKWRKRSVRLVNHLKRLRQ